MTRKRVFFLSGFAVLVVLFSMSAHLLFSVPAQAQYLDNYSTKPSIEINLDVLGGEPEKKPEPTTPTAPAHTTPPPLNDPSLAPVTESRRPETVLTPPPSHPAPAIPSYTQKRVVKPVPLEKPVVQSIAPTIKPAPVVLPIAEPKDTKKTDDDLPVMETLESDSQLQEEEKQAEPIKKTPPPSVTAPTPQPPAVPTASDLTLIFNGNESVMNAGLEKQLASVLAHMNSTPESRLQVRAYATGEDGTKGSARRISLSRALAVRSALMDKGVKPNRVDVRALGMETDRSPLDRVDLIFVP